MTQRPPSRSHRKQGMALVVTLSLVVLAAIAAMAFFARATANRIIETTRTQQVLAEQVARSAVDAMKARFLAELGQNATAFIDSGRTIYQPNINSALLPARQLAQPSMLTDANFFNLVWQSSTNSTPPSSSHSSASASQNGRAISADRWNAPRLLTGSGLSSAQVPYWIYVNRDGSLTATPSTNAMGRFAANVYQTAGLLDANVAGFPSSVSGNHLQTIKSTSAGADLNALGVVQTAVDAFVNFRNPSSSGSGAAYQNYVRGAVASGFQKPVVPNFDGSGTTTNRLFQSRQDLLRYAETQNSALTNALPFLTHVSRSITAPSWSPVTPSGSSIPYAANANSPTATNRFFPNVRVTVPFTRQDGSPAQPGEPLVQRRFPLSRLSWLGPNGPTGAASASEIQQKFGLVWDASARRWDYVGSTGNTLQTSIKTLHQVANEAREPNFFELLKAAILSGSVGTASQNKTLAGSYQQDLERDEDLQIIRIGACIIDQADADNFPTSINLGGVTQYGVEDLPYLHTMPAGARWRYRVDGNYTGSGLDFSIPKAISLEGYAIVWAPKLFRPHSSSSVPSTGPTQIRVRLASGAISQITHHPLNMNFINDTHNLLNVSSPINLTALPQTEIILPATSFGNFAATPKIIEESEVSNPACSIPNQLAVPFWNTNPSGDRACGFVPYQTTTTTNHSVTSNATSGFRLLYPRLQVSGVMIVLEFWDGTGWRPYDALAGHPDFPNLTGLSTASPTNNWDIGGINFGSGTGAQPFGNSIGGMHAVYKIDLRTTRWAAMHGWEEGKDTGPLASTNRGFRLQKPFPTPILNLESNPTNIGFWPQGTTVPNNNNAPLADSLYRVNDAYRGPAANLFQSLSDTPRRPIILQRPFRSVAELGYVFRDNPWQTVNFFHASSGDGALLDVFCIDEEPRVCAGKVNLNMAPPPVVQALIQNISQNPDGTGLLSDAATAATNFVAYRNTISALPSKAHIANFLSSAQNTDTNDLKHRREALARGLADASDTRTWAFFLDVIAQAGRFGPGGTGPDRFIVEGESRLWSDFILDRYTGEILYQNSHTISQ